MVDISTLGYLVYQYYASGIVYCRIRGKKKKKKKNGIGYLMHHSKGHMITMTHGHIGIER